MTKADREEDIESWWLILLGVMVIADGIAVVVSGYAYPGYWNGGFDAWRLADGIDRVGGAAVLIAGGLYLFVRGLGIDWERRRQERGRRRRVKRTQRARQRARP